MKTFNIEWDTDGDKNVLKSLPKEMDIPEWLEGADEDKIADYLSDETGFCVFGFEIED